MVLCEIQSRTDLLTGSGDARVWYPLFHQHHLTLTRATRKREHEAQEKPSIV